MNTQDNQNKQELLKQMDQQIAKCTKCSLCKTAKNPVPGEGNINAEIVFIGEAPGATEDELGRPFVGRAGKLLDALIKALHMERDSVWIGNIIKHRPPNNRDPLPEEISLCEGYLTRQLEIINPVLILTLGRFAMNYFYPDGKISKDHGRLIKTEKYFVYPVYHPAAALRNGSMFEALKKDFAKVPSVISEVKNKNNVKNIENKKSNEIKLNHNDVESDAQLGLDL